MNHIKKNPKIEVIIHILAWCVLFGFPFIFIWERGDPDLHKYGGYFANTLWFFIVFYVNYFFLITRYLFNRKMMQFILSNLLLVSIGAGLLHLEMVSSFHAAFTAHFPPPPPAYIFIFRDATSLILSAGLSVAIRMTSQWYKVEAARKEMEKDRFETELKSLKTQLNPHFLFNTLNNIYSLIPIHAEQAQETVHRLSHLLRYVLYEDTETYVPIQQEFRFLKNYVELMSLRLPKEIEVICNIPDDPGNDIIAPMLFISLIENAFKHGISPLHPSFIHIDIQLIPSKQVTCIVENSYFPKSDSDHSGSGIGQDNLHKRIALLYPNRHTLLFEQRESTYFAQLTIYI
ncbi:sensor histidine kinase [Microbacter margulisiae]|uniref:Sensor histidine kinase YesM n=1 Tax=Microbacter margulisiae TaxID=1350067 RepID=A0A7W5H2S6_9PORP|nr:sensor histidine kinase [Microbacter margulisiae]MBB3187879.1 sensor histidine kinase YesM [Microbacter margulisiae]